MFEIPENPQPLDIVLCGLMRRYRERVPDVGRVVDCLLAENAVPSVRGIQNDHIAFRTMGVPHLGIASLEKIFLAYGYERRDRYAFEAKKLNAFWYAPPAAHYPRIFISELRVNDLCAESQQIIHSYTSEVTADPVASLDFENGTEVDRFLHSPLWRTPLLADYQSLASESEYAAWVIYNRYYLNHFTISIHDLADGFSSIEPFNQFLAKNDFHLNDAGGEIKISNDGLLKQSSTVAQMVVAEFPLGDGTSVEQEIPGSYVEFAERLPLPEFASLPADQLQQQHRRDGFEAANADKIFESTYSNQTRRNE